MAGESGFVEKVKEIGLAVVAINFLMQKFGYQGVGDNTPAFARPTTKTPTSTATGTKAGG